MWAQVGIWLRYRHFTIGPHVFGKVKISNFYLKLCLHQGLNKTNLPTKSPSFLDKSSTRYQFFKVYMHNIIYLKNVFMLTYSYLVDDLFEDSETL
jgi:hypothetical protein